MLLGAFRCFGGVLRCFWCFGCFGEVRSRQERLSQDMPSQIWSGQVKSGRNVISHKIVSKGFNWIQCVSRKSQGCFKEVSRVFQGNFIGVSTKSQGCFMKVSRKFQYSFEQH